MPSALHLEFFQDARRTVPGGLYVLSSPESKYYRPQKGFKRAYKIGSSWNLGKRVNGYLLSFPLQTPHGLEIEACLLMNLANTTKEKRTIAASEDYVHKQLHGHYTDPKHFPGHEGSRLNIDRIEWYSGIDLDVILKLLKHVEGSYGGVLCRGNENYATKWREYLKRRRDWSYREPLDFFKRKKCRG